MVAALTLVVVGAGALINALTSDSSAPPPGTVSPTVSRLEPETPRTKASRTAASPALEIRVIGQPTTVFVRESGTGGAVLLRGVLGTGETRQYEQAPLDVVVENSDSVEVRIYGELQVADSGGRAVWSVPDRSD